jgi:hypothetical protein
MRKILSKPPNERSGIDAGRASLCALWRLRSGFISVCHWANALRLTSAGVGVASPLRVATGATSRSRSPGKAPPRASQWEFKRTVGEADLDALECLA